MRVTASTIARGTGAATVTLRIVFHKRESVYDPLKINSSRNESSLFRQGPYRNKSTRFIPIIVPGKTRAKKNENSD